MKNQTILILLIMAGLILACESETSLGPDDLETGISSSNFQDIHTVKKTTKSTNDVFNAVTGHVIGESTLNRNGNGVTINFKTSGLTPGYAYTLWWVIWNKPENCIEPGACTETDFANALNVEVQLLYASGHVAGNNGKGNFSAHLKENDDSGSVHELFGLPNFGGLQDAKTAEIHAVIRSHGPKIPGLTNEQINSYEGGCSVNFPAFTEIPDEPGECGDIIASIHRL